MKISSSDELLKAMGSIAMKTAVGVGGYANSDIENTVQFVQEAEKLGVHQIWSAEAWGQDAVTSLAFLAPRTSQIKLGTGIMQINARGSSMTQKPFNNCG